MGRGNTPYGLEDPSLLHSQPSNRCGSASRSTTNPDHPSSTGNVSKKGISPNRSPAPSDSCSTQNGGFPAHGTRFSRAYLFQFSFFQLDLRFFLTSEKRPNFLIPSLKLYKLIQKIKCTKLCFSGLLNYC